MKRNHHHPDERRPKEKDNEIRKPSPFRMKKGKEHIPTEKKAKLGPKMTRNTTKLRDCLQAAIMQSLKDNTGYQYRYTGVTRPLKGTVFLFIDKGGCRGIIMP